MGQGLPKRSRGDIDMEHEDFPTTLEEFGYGIRDGELRHKETGEKFVFDVRKGNRRYNQRHYEALGESLTSVIYKMLEQEAGLQRITIPEDAGENDATSCIFMSEDAKSCKKLMILIHGTGVVRAGQWARSLIINDCLETGTQLPYIRRAMKEGYGVVVLNTNQNTDINGRNTLVKGSESPEDHFIHVWDTILKDTLAEDVVIVAHSYGGVVTLEGVRSRPAMMKRIKAVAFTDGVHSLLHQAGKNKKVVDWFKKHSVNWVSSNQPLDQPLKSFNGSEPKRSAGTMRHERTSASAFDPIFQYFKSALQPASESDKQTQDEQAQDEKAHNEKAHNEKARQTEFEVKEWIKTGMQTERNGELKSEEQTDKTMNENVSGKSDQNNQINNEQDETVQESAQELQEELSDDKKVEEMSLSLDSLPVHDTDMSLQENIQKETEALVLSTDAPSDEKEMEMSQQSYPESHKMVNGNKTLEDSLSMDTQDDKDEL